MPPYFPQPFPELGSYINKLAGYILSLWMHPKQGNGPLAEVVVAEPLLSIVLGVRLFRVFPPSHCQSQYPPLWLSSLSQGSTIQPPSGSVINAQTLTLLRPSHLPSALPACDPALKPVEQWTPACLSLTSVLLPTFWLESLALVFQWTAHSRGQPTMRPQFPFAEHALCSSSASTWDQPHSPICTSVLIPGPQSPKIWGNSPHREIAKEPRIYCRCFSPKTRFSVSWLASNYRFAALATYQGKCETVPPPSTWRSRDWRKTTSDG